MEIKIGQPEALIPYDDQKVRLHKDQTIMGVALAKGYVICNMQKKLYSTTKIIGNQPNRRSFVPLDLLVNRSSMHLQLSRLAYVTA